MAYNPRIKTFVMVDTNGNTTTVVKKALKRPKIGNWIEVPSNICCTTTTTEA